MGFERIAPWCGILGPAAFTASWTWATWIQHGRGGYTIGREHISGLGAPDALAPRVMNAGFVALGAGAVVFASALERELDPPAGPRPQLGTRLGLASLRIGGASAIVAAVLRRDHMLLSPPAGRGSPPAPSWRNRGHDAASAVGYGCLLLAPLLVGGRRPVVPVKAPVGGGALATAVATGTFLALFATRLLEPYNGIVQRVAVTLPLWWMSARAIALVREAPPSGRPGEQRT